MVLIVNSRARLSATHLPIHQCTRPPGYVLDNTDCNDNHARENPSQVWFKDLDNDGYSEDHAATIGQCARPVGYKLFSKDFSELIGTNDCNDNNPNVIRPQDWYPDADADGFGSSLGRLSRTCFPPAGYVKNNSDCNDNNAIEKPGQLWYLDTDSDGYGATGAGTLTQCLRTAGYKLLGELTATTGDCNDGNAAINPGAPERCDGKDNNCNGKMDDACGLITSSPSMLSSKTIAEHEASVLEVRLWPNPARDVLMVTLDAFVPNQKMELVLMQADGKLQTAQSLVPNMKGQQVRMDVSRMAAGYYLLVARQQGMVVSKQVFIMR